MLQVNGSYAGEINSTVLQYKWCLKVMFSN